MGRHITQLRMEAEKVKSKNLFNFRRSGKIDQDILDLEKEMMDKMGFDLSSWMESVKNMPDEEFETILNTPGKVMEVFNVKVKEGQEETFQKLRERFITLARNTNNVENVYKFTVNRDIMQPDD